MASKTGSVCISTLSGDHKKVVSAAENEATDEKNVHEVSTASLVTGWEMRISIW
jgi:hypothetical protein